MADQETSTDKPESGWRFEINSAGTYVFVIASVALVGLVVFSVLFEREDSAISRATEAILTVAGLGIIISFLLSARNALLITLTLLVVAALVVPSRDIVRFVLVTTGSDRSLEEFYGRAGISSNITSRVDAVSLEILNAVEKEIHDLDQGFTPNQRERLVSIIGDVVQRDRTQTLFERVSARGVLELLEGINQGQANDFVYRYRDVDRLQEDLRYLRYEGLISITYEDLDSIEITPLGRSVVQVSSATDVEIQRIPDLFGASGFSRDCTRIEQERLAGTPVFGIEDLLAGEQRYEDINDDEPRFLRIRVLPGFVGTYQFDYRGELDESGFAFLDPRFTLYGIGTGATAPDRVEDCEWIAADDDGGEGLDARIEADLRPGWYLLRLGAFGSSAGTGLLSVAED